MRWKQKSGHKLGDTRRRSRFLLVPKCIRGEWRWLERAAWVERATEVYCGASGEVLPQWFAMHWARSQPDDILEAWDHVGCTEHTMLRRAARELRQAALGKEI